MGVFSSDSAARTTLSLHSPASLGHDTDQNQTDYPGPQRAHAYASTRGSAPALSTPVLGSTTIAAFEPSDHAPAVCSLCPFASSAFRTASGTRDSTDRLPGSLIRCGNTE